MLTTHNITVEEWQECHRTCSLDLAILSKFPYPNQQTVKDKFLLLVNQQIPIWCLVLMVDHDVDGRDRLCTPLINAEVLI
jgi:hypothetical protein